MGIRRTITKLWWLWALLFLAVIFLVAPHAWNVDLGLFTMHPPEDVKSGSCYNNICLIDCYEESTARPYRCSTQCGDKYEVKCSGNADCTEAKLDCEVSNHPASENDNPLPGSNPDTSLVKKDNTIVKTACNTGEGKLYKGSAVWNDCEGKGCWTKDGIGVCKSGDSIGDFFNQKFYGMPVWIVIAGLLFILLLMGMGKKSQ